MFESYLLTTDGKEYIDANSVREALGVVDEHVDILGVIKKLKEERDGLKADLDLTNRLYKEHHNFVDKVCEAVDIRRPYIESEYDNAVKLVAGFKRERDELKEKCDKMKKRANAVYGVSCGKEPAFLCDVISYSWSFGAIDTPFPDNSIRVELNLTPTANYKGTFDLEDLKKYIQAYGREKKLGIIESVDYQNAKAARAELAYLYKTVLGKEKLDRDLSPHEVMKYILDEYKRGRMERLPELVNDCIDELCDKYNVIQPVRSRTTRERLDYIFAVLADYREMHDSEWNRVEKLIKEKRAVEDSLAELRAKIHEIHRSVVDDEWNNLSYTSALNDINEEYKRVARNFEKDTFRSAICNALGMPTTSINGNIIGRIHMRQDCHNKLCKDYTELRKAIWEAMDRKPETLPEENARLVGEVTELARGEKLLIEFRDAVAKAIGMEYPTTNQVILQNVKYIYKDREDAYGMVSKLNDQVTALEKAKEDLQQMLIDSRYGGLRDSQRDLLGEYLREAKDILGIDTCEKDTVASAIKDLKSVYNNLRNDYDEVCEGYAKLKKDYDELGEAYSSVLKWNNSYAEVRRLLELSADADADEMVDALDQLIVDREKCKRRYENWYSRYESEHERANGEHKRAEKLRKDVTALSNHIELLKLSNASQANSVVASQAFKNECRKLKEEKGKVIAALGQDIWDDCVKEETDGSNEDS